MPSDAEQTRGARLGYLPALDGLRGLAVAAVLLFHAGLTQVRGGHLGVSVFFTLSGFLITALLLLERQKTGHVDLQAFWGRRARRLVPAMLLCLPLVALVLHLSDQPLPRGVLGDAIASATWVANWRFIFTHQTYADLFAMPSPFQHFWSLAVEEQFYLVFPLLFVYVVGRRQGAMLRGRLAAVLGVIVVLSTLQAAHLQAAGGGLSRAYYGTDARIAELLVGGLLALVLVRPDGLRELTPVVRHLVGAGGLVGLAGVLAAFALINKGDAMLYRGGFLALAVASSAVIAAAVQPRSAVSRLLALEPAVALGRISYGVYLFHWPIFLLLTKHFTGYDGFRLLLLRLVVTLLAAYGSYVVFEQPIRYGYLPLGRGLVAWAGTATAGVVTIALATGQLALPKLVPPVQTAGSANGIAPAVVAGRAPTKAARPVAPVRVGQQRAAQNAPSSVLGQQPVGSVPALRSKRAAVPAELVADPKKSKVPPVPTASAGQFKVAIVGDSIGFNLGHSFLSWQKERSDIVAYDLSIPGCPLSRGGERRITPDHPFAIDPLCGWWDDPSSQRRQALEQFAPDVVIVEDGINEVFDRKLPEWTTWQHAGDPQFDQWLSKELSTAIQGWSGNGAKILLTNTPCGDWQRYDTFDGMSNPPLRVRQLNLNIYDSMPGVQHADLFNRICPGGQYTDTVEGVPNGRPDGFHFSAEAGLALVRNWLGPLAQQTANSPVPPLVGAGPSAGPAVARAE
jgi:peptidoglycan/LPS O-acetylase OafA/YrhL